MISDKAMLICLHITMWTARKHDKRVSEEVAQSHEANTNAGRYNKHLLDQAEKLEELRALAGQIRQYFYKVTLPWSDEGYRLLPSHLYFEFTNQMSEFKTAYEQLVREFLDAYPTYREQARNSLGLLYRDSDYPDSSGLTEKFDLTTDILPIPCGEDFRVTLGAEEKARVAREIDQQVKQSLTRATCELWSRLMQAVAHLAATLERPKARLHTSTLRNVTEIADLVPRLNVTNDEELSALAQETNSRLSSFTRQDLAQHPAARTRAAGIANDLAAKIKRAMKDRGYDTSDESAAIGHISGTAEAPVAVVVQMHDPKASDPATQPAPAPQPDQIMARMFDYMELMAS
jgi:hypothetical protein